MTVEIIFEFHSISLENEAGAASGWRDPLLLDKENTQSLDLVT